MSHSNRECHSDISRSWHGSAYISSRRCLTIMRYRYEIRRYFNSHSLNHVTYFSSLLFSHLSAVIISILRPIPFLRLSQRKNLTVIFVYITVFIVHDGEGVGDRKKEMLKGGSELMYGWIKLSYPTPPSQGPFYSPSIAEIGFSSALCHSIPYRPPFGPINSRSRLNNKNRTMAAAAAAAAAFSVTGAEGRY